MENYPTQNISKNIFSITTGQAITLVINFFSISLTARFLKVDDFGIFNYILATVVLLSKLIDLGVSQIAFRETSKQKNNFSFIYNAVFLRVTAFIIVFLLFNLFIKYFHLTSTEMLLADILFINIVISSKFQNFRELLEIPFKVNLEMHFVMVFNIIDNLVFLLSVILMPYFHGGLVYLVISYVVANLPGFVLALIFLNKKFDFLLKIKIPNWQWMLKESLPVGGFVILVALFQQIDILILKNYDSAYATGIYAAATRLIIPIGIIPTALATTFFPKIVQNINSNNSNERILNLVYKVLFFISFMLAITTTFKAESIIVFIFGKLYAESAKPMIFLFWSYVFLFYNYFSSDIVTAYNKQIFNFIYALFVVCVDLLFIFILLPHYSFVGVAAAKLFAGILGTAFIEFVLLKLNVKPGFLSFNLIVWSFVMSVCLYFISSLPLFVYLFCSVIIMLVMIKLTRYFSNDEILQIFKILKKENWGKRLIKF